MIFPQNTTAVRAALRRRASDLLATLLLLCVIPLPMHGQTVDSVQMNSYARQYTSTYETSMRLKLANAFFAYLLRTGYIDEPISFPANSHIDSVDVNVYYYVAEWYYGKGDYPAAIDYCTRATKCMGQVDSTSMSDVYGLLGAAYFRTSAFDKASEALNRCYDLDKAAGDFDRMSSTLNGIASVFVAAGRPKEAEKYILEAISTNSLTDNQGRQAVLYGTASELYHKLGDKQQSLDYALKALDVEILLGDSGRIGVRLSQVATAQIAMQQMAAARSSLQKAMPLLLGSGNLHSWGICQNQMGDILASEGSLQQAAACYRDAAMLFLRQGDSYNELHAREGLYRVTKESSPGEALLQLERAKQLQDSIYQQETGEALGRYNAIYFNDLLNEEREHLAQRNKTIVMAIVAAAALLIAIIIATYWRHRRKVRHFEQHINTLEDESEQLHRQYQNVVSDSILATGNLTDDDQEFLTRLTTVIEGAAEKGITDIASIASLMNTSDATLRRRLSKTLRMTPQAFILQVRMQKARDLLRDYRDMTISDVADRCGYAQATNFTRAFLRYYGVKPSDVRILKDYTDNS